MSRPKNYGKLRAVTLLVDEPILRRLQREKREKGVNIAFQVNKALRAYYGGEFAESFMGAR
jgi:hypothetical protein